MPALRTVDAASVRLGSGEKGRSSKSHRDRSPSAPSIPYQDLKLEAMIGRGGFGRVYRAHWKTTDRSVAVKYLNKKFWHHDMAVRALIAESQKAQRIIHSHIICHHGWGQAPSGAPFLVMDLVDGPNLTDWIHDSSFDVAEVQSCATQICDSLVTLHQIGILHGDISPANILRRASHDFVLTDFGFSRSIDDGHSAPGGTLGFLAPEQFSSAFGTISERTDIYGFGALLYFLVTHRAPFERDDERDIIHRILSSDRPPEVAFPGMPLAKLTTLARACLAKEPSERITTMEEVRSALHQ